MRRSFFLVGFVAVLTGLGIVVYEKRVVARTRASLAAEQMRLAQHQHQLLELRQQRDEAQRDLALAKQILASADAASTTSIVRPEHAPQIDAWLTRVKRFKRSFDENPAQRIPELQLLTDLDWLTLTRQMKLESPEDLRKAWAEIRHTAYTKLEPPLRQALRDYTMDPSGIPLSDLSQLLPYLRPPIDAAILQRYEITNGMDSFTRRNGRMLAERAPIDIDFDTRHTLSLDGGNGSYSQWALESFRQADVDAYRQFSAANPGRRPTGDADLLPYIRNPSVKAIFEAKVAYQNDSHRVRSGGSAALRPYVSDPNARAMLEKMIESEELEGRRSTQ